MKSTFIKVVFSQLFISKRICKFWEFRSTRKIYFLLCALQCVCSLLDLVTSNCHLCVCKTISPWYFTTDGDLTEAEVYTLVWKICKLSREDGRQKHLSKLHMLNILLGIFSQCFSYPRFITRQANVWGLLLQENYPLHFCKIEYW